MDCQVLEVLPGNRAIVSTEGLQRVERAGTGGVLCELLEPYEAATFVETYNDVTHEEKAVAVEYEPAAVAAN